jgi:hypothetical protein
MSTHNRLTVRRDPLVVVHAAWQVREREQLRLAHAHLEQGRLQVQLEAGGIAVGRRRNICGTATATFAEKDSALDTNTKRAKKPF